MDKYEVADLLARLEAQNGLLDDISYNIRDLIHTTDGIVKAIETVASAIESIDIPL